MVAGCQDGSGQRIGQPSLASELYGVVGETWAAEGLSGRGVTIGIIDAGFAGLRRSRFTQTLNVSEARSFLPGDTAYPLEGRARHGASILEYIGGRSTTEMRGLAHDAVYFLAKGEFEQSEPLSDERSVITALDWLVASGVRLINISLGFTQFDDAEPYSPSSMNGRTTAVSRRLSELLEMHPDLIVVASAGNQGDDSWRYVTAPGDVEAALTVGAIRRSLAEREPASGIGRGDVPFVKPDLMIASGRRGASSVATAVVTGLVACLLEARPGLTRSQVVGALKNTASNAPSPNREIGYGVPNASAALAAIRSISD